MLPEATMQRLRPLLEGAGVRVAYFIAPLPRGVLSAAQGGLAILLPATLLAAQRYEAGQRLRFQLMGVLPPGRGEVIVLNDSRPSLAAAVVERGTLVFSSDEAERRRFEMVVLSRVLEFTSTLRRFLGEERLSGGEQSA